MANKGTEKWGRGGEGPYKEMEEWRGKRVSNKVMEGWEGEIEEG